MTWPVTVAHETIAPVLARGLAAWLPGFLPRQRWFGGKTRAITGATLDDVAWLEDDEAAVALAIARVAYRDGAPERYALLLGADDTGAQPALGALGDLGDLGKAPAGAVVAECATHPAAAWRLVRRLAAPATLPTAAGGRLVFADMSPGDPQALDAGRLAPTDVRPLGAEQSNTSLRVGSGHVFKLLRKLESGEHPELEMTRFLTRAGFRHAPALRGSVSLAPTSGPPTTLGVLQDLVPNHGDGWSWARARLALGGPTDPELGAGLRRLGEVTGELHTALASDPTAPAFAPQPATARDLEAWRDAWQAQATRALGLVARLGPSLPEPARTLADDLGRRGAAPAPPTLAPPEGGGAFATIRIHGDYHLGQTLRTDAGFVVIDFEGEPVRPLAERRARHCALRDVAGMLRSLDYVIRSADPAGPAPAADDAARLRGAFLAGYRAATTRAVFLPRDPDAAWALERFFELDKALYEAEYELNHRPGWAHIPLAGIVRLLEDTQS